MDKIKRSYYLPEKLVAGFDKECTRSGYVKEKVVAAAMLSFLESDPAGRLLYPTTPNEPCHPTSHTLRLNRPIRHRSIPPERLHGSPPAAEIARDNRAVPQPERCSPIAPAIPGLRSPPQ